MRSIWILPDRSQTGDMLVEDGGRTKRLAEVLDLSRLPPALVLGIPEELLRQGPSRDCIYAQLARLTDATIFCLSLVCGRDKSGRIVTLTNVQILNEDERPELPPPFFNSNDPHVAEHLSALSTHFSSSSNPAVSKIVAMLDAARKFRQLKTFASDRLKSSANKPDWMPDRHMSGSQARTLFLIAVLVFSALIVWTL